MKVKVKSKLRLFLVISSSVLIVGTIFISKDTLANTSEKSDPLVIADKYFKGLRDGNFDEVVKISRDKKYNNSKIQKEEYAESYRYHPLLDYKIVSVDKSNLNDIKLTVSLTYPEFGTLPLQTYNVVKENEKYIVVVNSVVINMDSSSANYNSTIPAEFK